MKFEFLLRGRRLEWRDSWHAELQGPSFQLRHHFAVLLGAPFMELVCQALSLPCAATKILVAAAAFMHHAAGQVHDGIKERMRGTAILCLDVVHGIANAHI